VPFDPATSAFTCDICRNPLNPDGLGVSRRLTGWVANRKQGGANAIKYPGPPTGFAHNVCLEAAHTGPQTASLF
jgi:hypothetical protein